MPEEEIDTSQLTDAQMLQWAQERAASMAARAGDDEEAPYLLECEILTIPEELDPLLVDDYVQTWMSENGAKSEDPNYACLVLPVAEARTSIIQAPYTDDNYQVGENELVIEFRPYASEPFTHQMALDMQQMAQALEEQYRNLRVYFRPLLEVQEEPERFRLVWDQPTEVEYTVKDEEGNDMKTSLLERVTAYGNFVYDTEDQAWAMAAKLNENDPESAHRVESNKRGILA